MKNIGTENRNRIEFGQATRSAWQVPKDIRHALRAAPRDVWVRFSGMCWVHLPGEREEAVAADTQLRIAGGPSAAHAHYLILSKALLSTTYKTNSWFLNLPKITKLVKSLRLDLNLSGNPKLSNTSLPEEFLLLRLEDYLFNQASPKMTTAYCNCSDKCIKPCKCFIIVGRNIKEQITQQPGSL